MLNKHRILSDVAWRTPWFETCFLILDFQKVMHAGRVGRSPTSDNTMGKGPRYRTLLPWSDNISRPIILFVIGRRLSDVGRDQAAWSDNPNET